MKDLPWTTATIAVLRSAIVSIVVTASFAGEADPAAPSVQTRPLRYREVPIPKPLLITKACMTFGGDLLHREPMVTTFRVRGLPPGEAFTFTLVNIHTDPDETDTELDALDDVFASVQRGDEDDVILLGDLNVDEYHLGELGRLPGITWAITGQMTNTRRTKAYDNIVFSRQQTAEFTGTCGVFDLMAEFGLSVDEALEVSDHLPVWAEFSVRESTAVGPVAARPGASLRRQSARP